MGRIETLDDLRNTVVALRGSVPVYVRDIARVEFGPQIKRGESAYNGQHAVIMQITKQPGANTLELTERVEAALDEIRAGLPEGVWWIQLFFARLILFQLPSTMCLRPFEMLLFWWSSSCSSSC